MGEKWLVQKPNDDAELCSQGLCHLLLPLGTCDSWCVHLPDSSHVSECEAESPGGFNFCFHDDPWGFLGGTSGKEPACQCRKPKRCGFDHWVREIPWRRVWQPTPVFLPGKPHGQRSLGSYSPWDCKESNTTEHSHTMTDWTEHLLMCVVSFVKYLFKSFVHL